MEDRVRDLGREELDGQPARGRAKHSRSGCGHAATRVESVNEMKAHVPPVTTSDVLSFPFENYCAVAQIGLREASEGNIRAIGEFILDASLDDVIERVLCTIVVAPRTPTCKTEYSIQSLYNYALNSTTTWRR